MIASQMTHFLSPSRLSNSILDTFTTSTSKSLVLAFIWILLLSFIFILFVYILGASGCKSFSTEADVLEWGRTINASGIYYAKTTTAGITPASLGNVFVLSVYDAGTKTLIRTCAYQQNGTSIIQMNNSYNGTWQGWHDISIDFPSFYKNYSTIALLSSAVGDRTTRPKRYEIEQQGGSIVVDSDFQYTNRDSRILVVGYDMKARRSGLVLVNQDKTLNWLMKPSGWDTYFSISVNDTNISVTRVGSQNYFYCGTLNWWEV